MKKIIYISDIPWKDITQRQHHLSNNLANHAEIIYFSCNSVTQLKKYFNNNYLPPFKTNPRLKIIEFFFLPFTRLWLFKQINFFVSFIFLYFYFLKKDFSVILSHPSQEIFLNLPAKDFYYDFVDDASEFQIARKNSLVLKAQENKILERCNAVFAPSRLIEKKVLQKINNVIFIPNGVNKEHFSLKSAKLPEDLKIIGKPLVGFYGAINELIDLQLVLFLSQKLPIVNFIFIGPVSIDISLLKNNKNVFFLGIKPYSQLPFYLVSTDIWIIPFKQNNFSSLLNPVKVYEYLAAERTIITTYLPELEWLGDLIFMTKSSEQFMERLNFCLNNQQRIYDQEKLEKTINENSWPFLAEKMAKQILEKEN